MTEFTTWAVELLRWKNALANRDIDSFWVMSTENSREMHTTYTRLDNISKFTEWLENKKDMESLRSDEGKGGDSVSILQFVAGGN